jgi:hypothetical protein
VADADAADVVEAESNVVVMLPILTVIGNNMAKLEADAEPDATDFKCC